MAFKRCPGSVAFSQPTIELIRCSKCGEDTEVWSDEAEGQCPKCGNTVLRVNRQSCVDWCKYAEECLGQEKYKSYQDMKSAIRKEALVGAAADRFAWNDEQVSLAHARLEKAEELLRSRPEADPNVVIAAVVLSGASAADEAGTDADEEQRGALQTLLEELNYPQGFVRQVCGLLSSGLAAATEDANAAVVHAVLSDKGPTS